MILTRGPKLCNFVEWRGFKVVYKRYFLKTDTIFPFLKNQASVTGYFPVGVFLPIRYASLYFCMCINQEDNELEVLEIIHHFVEILDRYFGSVSYLNFNKFKILLKMCYLEA